MCNRLLQIAEKVPILKDRINGNLLYPQKVLEEGVKDSNVVIDGRLKHFKFLYTSNFMAAMFLIHSHYFCFEMKCQKTS